ncbi:FBP domain-containing protein [Agromyces archimandritae]|uniref:FBP domain-containing protein n=1 Tax=Agromyces archimandritae TaxID=2781962 RepID=A0A975IMP5_9MICO|nr:FBP domain-containing protein [Agromyces archimandritae]QTX03742.1 FBP domain-containing protein [Agromyces archimandritae]
MRALTETDIRGSFVNASRKEIADLALPLDFAETDWASRDFYGWRDRKAPMRGAVVVELGDRLVGVSLRRADAKPRTRAQCSWCQDVELTREVVFYAAKRAGDAGRRGDTVGTLVCADFGCPANVRRNPSVAYVGFDVEAARGARIEGLAERVRGFAASVLGE